VCVSRVHQVVAAREGAVSARDVDGAVHDVSLLAFEGGPPAVGEWVSVHSGYAMARVDEAEALEVVALIDAARRAGLDSPMEEER
jgi:hydrogenase expression/formation protein HypC